MNCQHCHSTTVVKYGCNDQGKQRYRCKSCVRISQDGKPKYTQAFKQKVIRAYLIDKEGIRQIARHHHISHSLVLYWVRQFIEEVKHQCYEQLEQLSTETVQAQEEGENNSYPPTANTQGHHPSPFTLLLGTEKPMLILPQTRH